MVESRILPAPGLQIFDPVRRDYLPPEGRDVDLSDHYWHRLLLDGDIVLPAGPIVTAVSKGSVKK